MNKTYMSTDYNCNCINITLMTTSICNYNCKYCSENDIMQKIVSEYIDFTYVLSFIEQIRRTSNKKIIIQLYGGEPTLHKELLVFCEQCQTLNCNIVIYTNFSATTKYYNCLLAFKNIKLIFTIHTWIDSEFLIKLKSLDIKKLDCCSFIYIFNDKLDVNQQYDMFQSAFNYLKMHNMHRNIRMYTLTSTKNYIASYSNENIEQMKHLLANINCSLSIVDQNVIMTDDIYDQLQYDHYNWLCSAGKDNFFIDTNNVVFPCYNYFRQCHCNENKITEYKVKNINSKTLCKLKNSCSVCCTSVKCQKIFENRCT